MSFTHAEREELERWIDIISEKAQELGLDPYPTHFEVVPQHVIYELGAYGLPARFSHWTFGRDYHRQKTSYEYGMSKIYEIVFNTDPTQAFLVEDNSMLSHKFVVAHVLGHSDFFKRNSYFAHTDRRMIEQSRLHAERIREYETEFGWREVEDFIDTVMTIEEHFDATATVFRRKTPEEYAADRRTSGEPRTSDYDDLWTVTGSAARPKPRPRKIPEEPEKDLLRFFIEYGRDLTTWQRDIIEIVREEMFYFLPQMRTKICNEGWACATGDSLLATERGFLRFKDIYEQQKTICVASGRPGACHPITDFHKEEQVPTLRVKTQRGYVIEGALKHRVQKADRTWEFLSSLAVGDRLSLAHSTGVWPQRRVAIRHAQSVPSVSLHDVARAAGTSLATIMRHRAGRRTERAAAIMQAMATLDYREGRFGKSLVSRNELRLPDEIDTDLGYLLGYFIGDGNFTKSGITLTCKDETQTEHLAQTAARATGLTGKRKLDRQGGHTRWRLTFHSRELLRFLGDLDIHPSALARTKKIPDAILQSPKDIMSAFLRGYFDADGYAGKQGIILSTSSLSLLGAVQTVLLNYGILSSQRAQAKEIWNLDIKGASAARFHTEIGFALPRKQEALEKYVYDRQWFKREDFTDSIASIEPRVNDVYDITVDTAHAYVANGLIHHNSFWHERILENLDLTSEEHWEFRRLHSSVLSPSGSRMQINPYYVGFQILKDIKRRWDGEVEPEDLPETDWMGRELARPNGQGLAKLFEVIEEDNDVTFLRRYLTAGLVKKLDLYTYKQEEVNGEEMWVVQDTDWRRVPRLHRRFDDELRRADDLCRRRRLQASGRDVPAPRLRRQATRRELHRARATQHLQALGAACASGNADGRGENAADF